MRKLLHLDDADGAGAHIRGDDALLVVRDVDHVGAILAGAENPVDLLRGGVVASNGLGRFGSEPGLAPDKGESMRATKWAEVDGRERAMPNQVEHGEGVVGAESRSSRHTQWCRPSMR